MKKSELNQIAIGNSIESKKTGEVLVINNIVEVEGKVKYELSNSKTTTQSSLVRWYNLIPQETVEQVEEVIPETTTEQLDKLVEQEAENIKLTALETEAMWILKNNEYEDCFDREFYHNPPTWDFVIIEGLSCGIKAAKGVLSSLVKKGLVIIDTEGEYNYNSKQYNYSICLTDLGYLVGMKALENYNPDEVEPEVANEEQPPVEPTTVENMTTSEHLHFLIIKYCTMNDYQLKYNSDHIAIKSADTKNLVELYKGKRAITLCVRHAIYTEEEQMTLDNCRLIGQGTFTLDMKFQIHKLDEFIDTLNRAKIYTQNLKKK